jgi:hypothetical protein
MTLGPSEARGTQRRFSSRAWGGMLTVEDLVGTALRPACADVTREPDRSS